MICVMWVIILRHNSEMELKITKYSSEEFIFFCVLVFVTFLTTPFLQQIPTPQTFYTAIFLDGILLYIIN